MIIQIFDTFYESNTILNKKIELKYLNIGIEIAEHNMTNIYNLLDIRAIEKQNNKYIQENYDEIAKKVKYYLKNKGHDEHHSLSTSKVIRQVWSLNKSNFDTVMQIASEKYGVKSESREFRAGQVATSYYYPSILDKHENHDYLEDLGTPWGSDCEIEKM